MGGRHGGFGMGSGGPLGCIGGLSGILVGPWGEGPLGGGLGGRWGLLGALVGVAQVLLGGPWWTWVFLSGPLEVSFGAPVGALGGPCGGPRTLLNHLFYRIHGYIWAVG